MIYVVLGMHKSGTTAVAEILHRSGIDMGDFDPSQSYDEGNQYERVPTQSLNRRLLVKVLRPPLADRVRQRVRPRFTADGRPFNRDSLARVGSAPIEASPALLAEMREVVAQTQARHADWGFKDPRNCLTYSLWSRVLPPHRVIAIYRDYRDLLERERRKRWSGLETLRQRRMLSNWIAYNRGLLRAVEANPEHHLLRYDRLMNDPEALVRLGDFVGRPLRDARRAELFRNRGAATASSGPLLAPLCREAQRLLAALDEARERL
jgi:hypothetical protein